MPYTTQRFPCVLGEVDFSTPPMAEWLAAICAEEDAVDVLASPQILLGAGSVLAQTFVDGLIDRGQVVALVDNARIGSSVKGVPVIGDEGLDDLAARVPNAVGVLCCNSLEAIDHFVELWSGRGALLSWFEVISRASSDDGFAGKLGFLREFGLKPRILALHAATRDVFTDELSRQTFDAVMLYRLTWDARFLSTVKRREKDIYFEPDVMPLGDHEVMVDGGAYDGDTVRDFLAKCDGKFDHIHSFEIDPANIEAFRDGTRDISHLSLHQMGLWNAPGEMGLEHRADNCSRLSETSTLKVPLNALDNLSLGRVSLLKLDIEGAEIEALQGARRTISEYKPKLALSIYHKADDFETILSVLKTIRPDYKFQLRHYSSLIFDTVLYAQ